MRLVINGFDLINHYSSITLSGSEGVCSRTMTAVLLANKFVGEAKIATHNAVSFFSDVGELIFQGVVVTIRYDQSANTQTVTAIDFGYILSQNTGWYDFEATPESATRAVALDIGMEVGYLEETGIVISENFSGASGTSQHKIISGMYEKAAAQNGQRYVVRFEGVALCVRAFSDTEGIDLGDGSGFDNLSQTVDINGFCNQVNIVSETGRFLRSVGVPEDGELVIIKTVEQKDGEVSEAEATANEILREGKGTVSLSGTIAMDLRLRTGATVFLSADGQTEKQIFYIVSDSHKWSNGRATSTIKLEQRSGFDD